MPGLAVSTCKSDTDCNGEGKCVPTDHDPSLFYCDCTFGFIAPHCRNRDPCLLEGNTACQNGATCKRNSNFEYECKCRVPYDGEFCETYNLCDVDAEECIGDLNTEDDRHPICNPCVAGATCQQVSKHDYVCNCDAGFNHSSCYTYPEARGNGTFITDETSSRNPWSPIIPTIAITSFCLYLLVLFIVLVLLWRYIRYRPKLIVCCNIHDYDDMSYYLISVETGRQCNAGTKSNVFCFLCGDKGCAGPYPLNDLNLREVNALQRCQEDNYLVSNAMDLGIVEKVVLWYDTRPEEDSWFCDKITVRNVKTNVNWYFYVSSWLNSKKHERIHEFLAASTEYVRERSAVSMNCEIYWSLLAKYHTYISPFVYATPERVTLLFAEWMSYMIILIALYGFLIVSDADIDYAAGVYIYSSIVPENGSLAAFSCFLIGLICTLLLLAFTKIKRIPTLLVWHNKPGMPEVSVMKELSVRSSHEPKFKDGSTYTDFDDLNALALQGDQGLIQHDEPSFSHHLFRIPSTDVVKTEKWLLDSIEKSHGSKDMEDEALVHNYGPSKSQLDIPDAVLDHGLIGGLTDGRQQEPNRFVYTYTTNTPDSKQALRTAIEDDIRDIYGDKSSLRDEYEREVGGLPHSVSSPQVTELFFKESEEGYDDSIGTQPVTMAGGDFARYQTSDTIKRVRVYCELCEMEFDILWNIMAKISIIIGWIVCLSLIIAALVICCIYGGRYGYQRTYDWIISLVICWLENFLVYQFLKIFLLVVILIILIKMKKLPSPEEEKLNERFQTYCVNGLTVLPKKLALRFVNYPPKSWIPVPYVKLDSSYESSTITSIIN